MGYFDYANVKAFLHDEELIRLLCVDRTYAQLVETFIGDDFLRIDPAQKVPFFAEVRDYRGAVERADSQAHWIVKPISDEDALPAAMGSICFFLDFFTHSISAPAVVTRIDGVLHKATRVITHAEQLTGANYTDIRQLKEQLILDLVNRWIYCDEDRNPNNYLIRYNSRSDQVIVAIDFSNVDLLHEGQKITGLPKSFGWARSEKTRYLTPLKIEHFLGYDMEFFDMRFNGFRKVGKKMLTDLCKGCLWFHPDRAKLARTISENLLGRIEYVSEYFAGKFPRVAAADRDNKYGDMGRTFTQIYKEKR
jgi:hypothetical protein